LVKIKAVPARTCTARELGLDLGEQTLNTKGAGLHGCWSSRAQRLSCREQPGLKARAHYANLLIADTGRLKTERPVSFHGLLMCMREFAARRAKMDAILRKNHMADAAARAAPKSSNR